MTRSILNFGPRARSQRHIFVVVLWTTFAVSAKCLSPINVTKASAVFMNFVYALPSTHVVLRSGNDSVSSFGFNVMLAKRPAVPISRWSMHPLVNGKASDPVHSGSNSMCDDFKGVTMPGRVYGCNRLNIRECPMKLGEYVLEDHIPRLEDLPQEMDGKWRLKYGWHDGKRVFFRYYFDIDIQTSPL